MKNIVEIKDLKKSYGDVTAVDGISFDVEEGSLFAFLGVNGAGKSTTINILCSILKKDGGKIYVNGLDLDEKPNEIKSLIGVVFQNSALDEILSVKDNLSIRAGFYGLKGKEWKKRLGELSDLLDLASILDKPIKNLSGGQKRRVDIARGLINYPKILILDEPTTGLDPQTRLKIWELIDNLRISQNMTVFLTTHYMEEANKADLVVVIDKGKIVARDTPHNLKAQFSSDYIKAYMPKNDEFERAFAKFLEGRSAEKQQNENKRHAALQKEAEQQAQNAENDEMDAKVGTDENVEAKDGVVANFKVENAETNAKVEPNDKFEVNAKLEANAKVEADAKVETDAKLEFKYDLQYCGDFYQLKVKDSAHAFEIINKFKRYITDFEILKGDMDDVFLNITGKSLHGPHESKTE